MDAELNVGMRNLGAGPGIRGHCWVTLPDGKPADEKEKPPVEYPVLMGCSQNGIRYWAGSSSSGQSSE